MTSSLGSINWLEWLAEYREAFTYICLFIIKDIIKETDEETNKEVQRVMSGPTLPFPSCPGPAERCPSGPVSPQFCVACQAWYFVSLPSPRLPIQPWNFLNDKHMGPIPPS